MAKKTKRQGIQKNLQKKKLREKKNKKIVSEQRLRTKPDVVELVDQALECVEDGDLREGSVILNKLKRKHRNHPHVNYGLGTLEAFRGDNKKAIEHFKRATELSPDFVEAHYNLGVAHKNEFNVPEMVDAFRNVIRIGLTDSYVVLTAKRILETTEEGIRKSDGISLEEFLIISDLGAGSDTHPKKPRYISFEASYHGIEIGLAAQPGF